MSKPKKLPDNLSRALALSDYKLLRTFNVQRSGVDEAARTVQLAFSSETPYERYWGIEILDHSPGAMIMDRLKARAPLLVQHNGEDQVGVVEPDSVRVGLDRVGRALARYSKSARGNEIFQDVVDEIRTQVSVGYIVHEARLVETKDGVDTFLITRWEPYEISNVSFAADITVGVGRSLDLPAALPASIPLSISKIQEKSMSDPVATAPVAEPKIEVVATRNHALEITKLASTIPGGAELAMRSIQASHTVEQFQAECIRAMATKPLPTADIGLTKDETKRYSFMRMINAMASKDPSAINAAGFEFECSRAVAAHMGKEPQGMYVPYDVMAMKRDLTVANAASAGNLKATNLLSASFIDLLRNELIVGNLGMTYLTGLVGDIELPRQTGTGTTYWLAEQAAPVKSNQTTDKVAMSPKTVGAKTVIGRKLRQQASIDVEGFVMTDLTTALALAMQYQMFNGDGTGSTLTGIRNRNIGVVALGVNAAVPNWGSVVDLETSVAVANASVDNMVYVTNARLRGKLKKTFVDAASNAERVWDVRSAGTPLNGYKALVTNDIPSNLIKGTSGTVCSSMIFGNWADCIVAMWGGLDILVDPYTGGDQGDISIRLLQDMDFNVRHPESFAKIDDALTT